MTELKTRKNTLDQD